MPDTKISALPNATLPISGTEVTVLVQSGNDVKMTTLNQVNQIFGFGNTHVTGTLYVSDGTSKLSISNSGNQNTIDGNSSANIIMQNGGAHFFMNAGGLIFNDPSNNNFQLLDSGGVQINCFDGTGIHFPGDGSVNIAVSTSIQLANNIGVPLIDTNQKYYDNQGNKILDLRQASVANPTGGSVIDVQARAQLVLLLTAMRNHGLIGP